MYGALVYTTPSHTEDKPRARVLFLLDSWIESAPAYSEAARFVSSQFEGPDTSVFDASRFFYGSLNCQMSLIGNVLPICQLRRFYAQSARVTKVTTKKAPVADRIISLDAERQKRRADALQASMPDELDKVTEALRKIDPYSVDYNRWIGIITALKREFGDAGLSVAESWAKGKPGEVQREWERVRTAGRSKEMHLGTIYYLAAGGR